MLNLAYSYAAPNNGNLASQTITRSGSSWTQNYTQYDAENRLTAASEGSNWTQSYQYDGYGNRAVTAGWVPNPYATPTSKTQYSGNRWSGAGYDNFVGNQSSLPSRSYDYDAENRLTWTSGPNIGWVGYGYDGEGRRVMKLVCPTGAGQCMTTTNGANLTVYVYDAAGKLAVEYGPQGDAGTRYLTADHLGSTRVVVDGSGVVQQCNDYLPFGEDIPAGVGGRGSCFPSGSYPGTGPDKANQKFTGKERDWETGLDFFESQYYHRRRGGSLRPMSLRAASWMRSAAKQHSNPARCHTPISATRKRSTNTPTFGTIRSAIPIQMVIALRIYASERRSP